MIPNSYLTDRIKIVTVSTDEYGKKTESTSEEIRARFEDVNKIIRNSEGQEVMAYVFVAVKTRNALKQQDKIMLVKKNGETYYLASKKWPIKSISEISGTKKQYVEVYL